MNVVHVMHEIRRRKLVTTSCSGILRLQFVAIPDAEVRAIWVVKQQRAGARFLIRHESIGELHAELFQPQQFPDACLILEIRTRRMTEAVEFLAIARSEAPLYGHFWGIDGRRSPRRQSQNLCHRLWIVRIRTRFPL
jgi:hypothetical protein